MHLVFRIFWVCCITGSIEKHKLTFSVWFSKTDHIVTFDQKDVFSVLTETLSDSTFIRLI